MNLYGQFDLFTFFLNYRITGLIIIIGGLYFVLYMGEGKESKMMDTKEEAETITHIYYLFTELLVTKITRSALRDGLSKGYISDYHSKYES